MNRAEVELYLCSQDINNMWLEFSDFFLLISSIFYIMSSANIIPWKWLPLKLQMTYFLENVMVLSQFKGSPHAL